MLLGKIRMMKVSLGIAGVLFAGLFIGHFRPKIDMEIIDFMREFGLVLFVYTIGIQIGPSFFASFRKHGLLLNGLAASVVAMGFAVASGIIIVTKLPPQTVVGVMSGAVTNTPGLGAAQEIIREAFKNDPQATMLPGLGYAMAYPFGIFGIIIVMLLSRKVFQINIDRETEEFKNRQSEITNAPCNYNLIVTNSGLIGRTLNEMQGMVKGGFVVSRLFRNGEILLPSPDTVFVIGDIIHVVTDRDTIQALSKIIGDVSEMDLRSVGGSLVAETISASGKNVSQKTVIELDLHGKFGVNLTRISRAGVQFVAHPQVRIQLGDRLTIVGSKEGVAKASAFIGSSHKDLEHPNIMPIFAGIVLGVLVGSIPFSIPGLAIPVKLGLAGGTLLVAILLGKIGQVGSISWYLPQSANLVLREIGITLFLACVGLKSGERFLETILNGSGFYWMALGTLITLIPLMVIAVISLAFFKMNFLSVCGILSGSMTDPPALSYACQMSSSDAPAITYASVYALTMFLRIIAAQLFVLVFM